MVPGISSLSAAAAATGVPLVQHDETLTVLPGTLPDDQLRARLAGADAVAVFKLGRTFGKVRAALDEAGLLSRARYVERAGTAAERVAPLADVDPDTVPYMSLALVPGYGRRASFGATPRRPRRSGGARRDGPARPGSPPADSSPVRPIWRRHGRRDASRRPAWLTPRPPRHRPCH